MKNSQLNLSKKILTGFLAVTFVSSFSFAGLKQLALESENSVTPRQGSQAYELILKQKFHNCMVMEANIGYLEAVAKTFYVDGTKKFMSSVKSKTRQELLSLAEKVKNKLVLVGSKDAFASIVKVASDIKLDSSFYEFSKCEEVKSIINNSKGQYSITDSKGSNLSVPDCQARVRLAFFYQGVSKSVESLKATQIEVERQSTANTSAEKRQKLAALSDQLKTTISSLESDAFVSQAKAAASVAETMIQSNTCYLAQSK